MIAREWHRRVLRVSGVLEWEIEYRLEPDGAEVLLVNGRVAAAGEAGAGPRRFLDFSVPVVPGFLPARLDVRTGDCLTHSPSG